MTSLINFIEENYQNCNVDKEEILKNTNLILEKLNTGEIRVAQKADGNWQTNEYIKKAILLYFKNTKESLYNSSLGNYYDKVPLKFEDWTAEDFAVAGFRAVPGAVVRFATFIAKNVVIMPCFVNIGAFIDEGTLLDSFCTIGSCAQIGKNCHISSNVVIAGVLEPVQSTPVIIEDNVFIGAGSSISEGVIVGEGSVIAAGVHITQSTKIINRETGETTYGYIPAYSVVVAGAESGKALSTQVAIIVKQVDEKTRNKTSINEILRA